MYSPGYLKDAPLNGEAVNEFRGAATGQEQ
jgi:hypothetical protein